MEEHIDVFYVQRAHVGRRYDVAKFFTRADAERFATVRGDRIDARAEPLRTQHPAQRPEG